MSDESPVCAEDRGAAVLRALLESRAEGVYQPLVGGWPDEPEGAVHAVRVASRRFAEALALARPLLPGPVKKQLAHDARRLRQSLGARREIDVLRKDLGQLPGSPEGLTEFDAALAVAGERASWAAAAFATPKRLRKSHRRVLEALDRAQADRARRASWRQIAGPHLHRRATAPERRLPALSDASRSSAHHRLRVDIKRLRYAAEILGPLFPDEVQAETIVPALKDLQDRLGALQDADDLRRKAAEAGFSAIAEAAAHLKSERHQTARDAVLPVLPDLLGAMRRAAGRIGPL